MMLRRIEAVRYGALAASTLGDLGPGLTVIHGPNEAGKSSYTSLVRHVLYGYPTLRDSEEGYQVAGEGRCARLVFEDEAGSWSVERVEGAHGGVLRVRTADGADRPQLLEDLTRGVSARTFRTVFGFGLDQMALIAQERASDDGVIARLYAAGAGLRVNPQEVRAAIEREAAELFKPAGRKQIVNEHVNELRRVRGELRQLRAETEEFLGDQERLRDMDERVDTAKRQRDEARERTTALAVALERAEERRSVISASEEALPELLRERKRLELEAGSLDVDDALLVAAPELEALLEEAAGHARALRSLADSEAAVLRAETRHADAAGRTALDASALETLGESHDSAASIDQAREDLQRLRLQCEARDEGVRRAETALEQARIERGRLLVPLGIEADVSESIAEHLAAVDAIEGMRGEPRKSGLDIPSLILAVSGIAALIAGFVLSEWLFVAVGAAFAAAGVVFLLRSGHGAPVLPDTDERAYLRLLGLDGPVSALELSRLRRALEAAKAADGAVDAAVRGLDEARREGTSGCELLEARQQQWSGWLREQGLDSTLTPAAASSVLTLAREVRSHRCMLEEARQAHGHAMQQLDAFAARFTTVAGGFLGLNSVCTCADVPAHANRLREKLAAAREDSLRRDTLSRAVEALNVRVAAEEDRRSRAAKELLEVLSRFDLEDGGTVEDLRAAHETAARVEAEAAAACDELTTAYNKLEGRLATGVRDRRTGELHLEESALAERLAEVVDRYAVLATAARLLGDAQSRYQRERQPEVVQRAGEIFETMTGGRYVGLSVPLAEGDIEVFDSRAGVRTTDILSRGTAEQLYLAIRLGLMSQLGEVGRGLPVIMDDVLVNFDPSRRRGAAEAIAATASGRQVLFFTCHPETADLFAEVAPRHTRLELTRIGA